MDQFIINHKPMVYPEQVMPGTAKTPFFVFAPPKSGSTFLNHILTDIAKVSPSVAPMNIPSWLFNEGIPFQTAVIDEAQSLFETPGIVFTGFRDVPQFLRTGVDIKQFPRVVMMRDPRDMLVSSYYSMKNSHPMPKRGATKKTLEETREALQSQTVEEYATDPVNMNFYRGVMDRMMQTGVGKNAMLIRYEDTVGAKSEVISRVVKFFGWEVAESDIKAACAKQDVFPDKEDENKHIRQVKPGNFKEKLPVEAIVILNEHFRAYLDMFGYPPSL